MVPAFSIVADQQHREVLRSEVSTLLAKEAIREVEQEDRQAGFYSHYFLVQKCDGTLANSRPQGPEQVSPAPKVQNVDCAKSETGCPCRQLVCNSRPQ